MLTVSVDELIKRLEAKKAEGHVDGDTLVGIPGLDNNDQVGKVRLEIELSTTSIAKDEFQKDWNLCRKVSRGGIKVLLLT
ncbi:hypothetical protein V8Z74_14635 [Comamonas sp. w2-DMI]|uniref:hypothetical protein n=1 Tax=Comamonas sp. w2-DMI TaxID=3126391 RepID=UPI0032E43D74